MAKIILQHLSPTQYYTSTSLASRAAAVLALNFAQTALSGGSILAVLQ